MIFRSRRVKNNDESGTKLEEVVKPTMRLESKTKAELIEIANSRHIKASIKLTKAQIIDLLNK